MEKRYQIINKLAIAAEPGAIRQFKECFKIEESQKIDMWLNGCIKSLLEFEVNRKALVFVCNTDRELNDIPDMMTLMAPGISMWFSAEKSPYLYDCLVFMREIMSDDVLYMATRMLYEDNFRINDNLSTEKRLGSLMFYSRNNLKFGNMFITVSADGFDFKKFEAINMISFWREAFSIYAREDIKRELAIHPAKVVFMNPYQDSVKKLL